MFLWKTYRAKAKAKAVRIRSPQKRLSFVSRVSIHLEVTAEHERRMAWSAAIPINAHAPTAWPSQSRGSPPDPSDKVIAERRQSAVREQARSYKVAGFGPVPALALAFVRLPEKHPRTPSAPFRRPKVIGVSGVERHGCRESGDGPGTALRRGPLKLRRTEGTFREAKSRMEGRDLCPLWGVCQSGSPEGAKREVRAHAEAALNT